MISGNKRTFQKIDYSNEMRQLNIAAKKGNEQETASLNINLKTVNKSYLQEYSESQTNIEQKLIINDYIGKDKGNFKSTRKLFGAEKGQKY